MSRSVVLTLASPERSQVLERDEMEVDVRDVGSLHGCYGTALFLVACGACVSTASPCFSCYVCSISIVNTDSCTLECGTMK